MAKPHTTTKPRSIDHQKRVILPPEVLEALDADTGDHVAFTIEQGRVTVHKARWVLDPPS